ncbi:PucR family transcriptional regulator [Amycolatopsis albispora]|uniref:PucR family transcriptional regulator n=1 Tax=Amycolatopsis albispora TaxID=1804986 RepID=UPI0013B470DD|nr:helix-turn-helix domain-containing protein [Amycolatopsis albispora]
MLGRHGQRSEVQLGEEAAEAGDVVKEAFRPGVRAATGISAPGMAGFRRSHREALAAQSVAITTGNGRPITCYADVELACLAAGSGGMAAMRALVERELGQLAATDDATTRLRDTLREYLAHGADARRAGAALHVHRNTVRYRVQQAEQALGHPIDERRAHLELALHCHHVYGADALPGSG